MMLIKTKTKNIVIRYRPNVSNNSTPQKYTKREYKKKLTFENERQLRNKYFLLKQHELQIAMVCMNNSPLSLSTIVMFPPWKLSPFIP